MALYCTLQVKIEGVWISKSDVGSPSEQPDAHDRVKASVSDALKRAAVKFGIGRYLYRIGSIWVDYDTTKRQFVTPPRLPDWAKPKTEQGQKPPTPKPQSQTTGVHLENKAQPAPATAPPPVEYTETQRIS